MELNKHNFRITNDDDELRVDGLCRDLLRQFHRELLDRGVEPLEAGSLAHGADYFLLDFVVSARRANLFDEPSGIVRLFAATWYIISNLEPRIDELSGHLAGIREFYRFLQGHGLISSEYLEQIEQECDDVAWYEQRIESFWDLKDDGYLAWERACSLKG